MRSLTTPSHPRRTRSLTGAEVVIVVVIMALAAALAAIGQPMIGVIEFLGAAVFLACRTLKALRDPRPAGIEGI